MTVTGAQVFWFTGLSGSGKSTLCSTISAGLEKRGKRVRVLDGDELRQGLCSNLGFSYKDRLENVRRTAHAAKLLSVDGTIVLVAVISPSAEGRDLARSILPSMAEVFVNAPLSVCESRDPKGLYRKARAGLLANLTGIDSPYEMPLAPDITCYTDRETIAESADKVLNHLRQRSESSEPGLDRLPQTPPRRCIAVDFDGTLAEYDGWKGEDTLGSIRSDVLSALTTLKTEGWKIIVHTTRGAEKIRECLVSARVPFDEINTNSDYNCCGPKPVATVYWDDRALRYSGDAASDIELIRNFRTWNGRR